MDINELLRKYRINVILSDKDSISNAIQQIDKQIIVLVKRLNSNISQPYLDSEQTHQLQKAISISQNATSFADGLAKLRIFSLAHEVSSLESQRETLEAQIKDDNILLQHLHDIRAFEKKFASATTTEEKTKMVKDCIYALQAIKAQNEVYHLGLDSTALFKAKQEIIVDLEDACNGVPFEKCLEQLKLRLLLDDSYECAIYLTDKVKQMLEIDTNLSFIESLSAFSVSVVKTFQLLWGILSSNASLPMAIFIHNSLLARVDYCLTRIIHLADSTSPKFLSDIDLASQIIQRLNTAFNATLQNAHTVCFDSGLVLPNYEDNSVSRCKAASILCSKALDAIKTMFQEEYESIDQSDMPTFVDSFIILAQNSKQIVSHLGYLKLPFSEQEPTEDLIYDFMEFLSVYFDSAFEEIAGGLPQKYTKSDIASIRNNSTPIDIPSGIELGSLAALYRLEKYGNNIFPQKKLSEKKSETFDNFDTIFTLIFEAQLKNFSTENFVQGSEITSSSLLEIAFEPFKSFCDQTFADVADFVPDDFKTEIFTLMVNSIAGAIYKTIQKIPVFNRYGAISFEAIIRNFVANLGQVCGFRCRRSFAKIFDTFSILSAATLNEALDLSLSSSTFTLQEEEVKFLMRKRKDLS